MSKVLTGAGMQPNDDQTKCDCMANTYDQLELGLVHCDGLSAQDSLTQLDECSKCPSCLDCSVPGSTKLLSGWALYGKTAAYRCPGKESTAKAACVGARLENISTSAVTWSKSDDGGFLVETMKTQCSEEYTGPICGTYPRVLHKSVCLSLCPPVFA